MRVSRTHLYLFASAFALTIGAGSLAGCHQPADAEVDKGKIGPQAVSINVAAAHQQTLDRTAELQGALYADESATLSSEVEGAISEVKADFGDTVAAGQVMLKISPREYQLKVETAHAALDQEQAKLANSTAKFQRAQQLKNEHTISNEQFDQLAAMQRIDEADTESAQKA